MLDFGNGVTGFGVEPRMEGAVILGDHTGIAEAKRCGRPASCCLLVGKRCRGVADALGRLIDDKGDLGGDELSGRENRARIKEPSAGGSAAVVHHAGDRNDPIGAASVS